MERKVIRIPRAFVATLGALFALFHAGLGISTLQSYKSPVIAAAAIALYLAAVLPSVLLYRAEKLPVTQGIFNLAAAALVPLLINSQLNPDQVDQYSTWYVIGVATLMAATAVRQQRFLAWLGTAVMVFQVIAWRGFIEGSQIGLNGAVMLVFAGHTISIGLERAYRDTMAYSQEALDIRTQRVVNAAASDERRERLDSALQGARPMLDEIKNSHGNLSETKRQEARLLEAALRDEIRGRGLMTQKVRQAAKNARIRGVEVIILDEGGLDAVDEVSRQEILSKAADSIEKVTEGRLTLRAPADEAWRVTLVATRPGIAKPDIWLKF